MKGKTLILAGTLLILLSCRGREKEVKRERTVSVTITSPEKRDILRKVLFTADIEGNPDIYVFSEIPGYFLKYAVNEGEKVEKDGVIGYIERRIPGMEYKPIPVKSPISGYVSELLRKKGEFVTQAKPIARVARYEKLSAILSLPAKYAGKLKRGEKAEIIFQDGRKTEGKINWISKTLDPFTKTLRVKILFKNPGRIYPGMVCEVKITVEKKYNVLSLEKEAVLGDIVKYVFIKKGNIARKKVIQTGIENEEYIEILSGLTERDTVILKGNKVLKDGMKIKIREE